MSAPDERELLNFAGRLSRHAAVAPRPEFRARLRASLLTAPVAFDPSRPSLFRWSRVSALRPVLAVVVVLALLVAAGGAAAASSLGLTLRKSSRADSSCWAPPMCSVAHAVPGASSDSAFTCAKSLFGTSRL